MKSRKTNYAGVVVGFILLIAVAAGVIYAFSNHLVLINTCEANTTLVFGSGSGVCLTHNSSAAISEGKIVPLPFNMVNGSPLLNIWNQPLSESANSYIFLSIPDTFEVHMQYNSTSSTHFMVMSNTEYVSWVNSGGSKVNPELSVTGKNISVWFNNSAGCAGYVAVIVSTTHSGFTIYPNETALYNPSTSPTGICANNG